MERPMPGDIVARRKGPVMHKGVVLADGSVLHNSPGRGEHVSSLEEFSAGRRVHVLRRRRDGAGFRAAPRRDRGYNLFTNNCEHTAYRASGGRAESPQLQAWLAGVGVAAVAFALTRHPGITAAGFALGRGLVGRFTGRV